MTTPTCGKHSKRYYDPIIVMVWRSLWKFLTMYSKYRSYFCPSLKCRVFADTWCFRQSWASHKHMNRSTSATHAAQQIQRPAKDVFFSSATPSAHMSIINRQVDILDLHLIHRLKASNRGGSGDTNYLSDGWSVCVIKNCKILFLGSMYWSEAFFFFWSWLVSAKYI